MTELMSLSSAICPESYCTSAKDFWTLGFRSQNLHAVEAAVGKKQVKGLMEMSFVWNN